MMGESAIAAAIQGTMNLAGIGLEQGLMKRQQDVQNEYNLQMWNLQNAYNSPEQQMKRLEAAGLNPNLMYGQGTTGNAQSAPRKEATPIADWSGAISDAFNIAGLETAFAQAEAAQAQAQIAKIHAAEEKDQREARHDFGVLYSFDPDKGGWSFTRPDVSVSRPMDRAHARLKKYTGASETRQYWFGKLQENDFQKNTLVLPKVGSLNSAIGRNDAYINYLAPQTTMLEYDAEYHPIEFWINQAAKATGALTGLVGSFYPKNWVLRRPPIRYNPQTYRKYYYNNE